MPEYLAPGVYVEETSYRSKSIEGVSTTTTGFIGPTRYGPVDEDPEILTSLGEFERAYGDGGRLAYGDTRMDNFVWHAARAFYTEGGKRSAGVRVVTAAGKEVDIACGNQVQSRLGKLEGVLECDADNALSMGACPVK